jgi:hypothetical protein
MYNTKHAQLKQRFGIGQEEAEEASSEEGQIDLFWPMQAYYWEIWETNH